MLSMPVNAISEANFKHCIAYPLIWEVPTGSENDSE